MTPLYDPQLWATLRAETAATDPHLLEDLMRDLRSQIPQQVTALEVAMAGKDFTTLREVIHRLKGSAGMLGLPCLALAAKELEAAATAKDLAQAQLTLAHFLAACTATFSDPAVVAIS